MMLASAMTITGIKTQPTVDDSPSPVSVCPFVRFSSSPKVVPLLLPGLPLLPGFVLPGFPPLSTTFLISQLLSMMFFLYEFSVLKFSQKEHSWHPESPVEKRSVSHAEQPKLL